MTQAIKRSSQRVQGVLGEELRALRKQRGWTRKDLLRHAKLDISLQTLATYELGTRQCTVVRLWELAEVLEEPMDQLIIRVMQRIGEQTVSGLFLDLHAAAKTTITTLGPLAAWARVWLRTMPEGHQAGMKLDRATLELLAGVCGTDMDNLVHRLQDKRAGLICSGR